MSLETIGKYQNMLSVTVKANNSYALQNIKEISRIPVYTRSFEAKLVIIQFLESFLHLPDVFILTSYKIAYHKAAKQNQSTVTCSVPLTPTILIAWKEMHAKVSTIYQKQQKFLKFAIAHGALRNLRMDFNGNKSAPKLTPQRRTTGDFKNQMLLLAAISTIPIDKIMTEIRFTCNILNPCKRISDA